MAIAGLMRLLLTSVPWGEGHGIAFCKTTPCKVGERRRPRQRHFDRRRRFAKRSLRAENLDLVGRIPLTAHGVGLSIGTDMPLDLAYLDQVAAVVESLQAPAYSEHPGHARRLSGSEGTPARSGAMRVRRAGAMTRRQGGQLPFPIGRDSLLSRWRRAPSSVTECGRYRESEHEPARELSADRRPIDNRHPLIVGARWRVLAARPGGRCRRPSRRQAMGGPSGMRPPQRLRRPVGALPESGFPSHRAIAAGERRTSVTVRSVIPASGLLCTLLFPRSSLQSR
jgi:hypothetical protein